LWSDDDAVAIEFDEKSSTAKGVGSDFVVMGIEWTEIALVFSEIPSLVFEVDREGSRFREANTDDIPTPMDSILVVWTAASDCRFEASTFECGINLVFEVG